MKLLIDKLDKDFSGVEVITEGLSNKKYYITGIFAQADKVNRNGRNYPKSAMESAIAKYAPLIEAKRALGELNHPDHPNVNLERASHIIESLEWNGSDIIGKARILTEMPMGRIVKGLIDEGVQIGVSTRGLGSLTPKNGVNIVQDDFIITAVDVVGDPSAPDAFVQGIMESVEWVCVNGQFEQKQIEETKKLIQSTPSKRLTEVSLFAFQNFLKSIK